MADKSLLIGDEAADLLLEYAALLAQIGRGDSVRIRAIGVDGDEVTVGFLLNSGTVLLVETSTSTLPEPDNAGVARYMRQRLDSYSANLDQSPDPFDDPGQTEDDAPRTARA